MATYLYKLGRWSHDHRRVVLAFWLAVLVGIAMTAALPFGVGLYGLLVAALGVALVTQPSPSTPRELRPAIQV